MFKIGLGCRHTEGDAQRVCRWQSAQKGSLGWQQGVEGRKATVGFHDSSWALGPAKMSVLPRLEPLLWRGSV